MTIGRLLPLLVGGGLAAALAAWCGLGAVGTALGQAGWLGLLAVSAFHLLPKALCGAAWRLVLPRGTTSLGAAIWFRWLRDGANDLLSLVPAVGEIAAIRAMVLRGVGLAAATASTIVDLTIEMAAQCGFIALVLVLLLVARPDATVIGLAGLGLVIMVSLLIGLLVAQRRGTIRVLDRLIGGLAARLGAALSLRLDGVYALIRASYADRRRLSGALLLHLLAWWVGIGEGWLGLSLMGHAPGWLDIVMLECCAFILRSAGFMLPGALGIQEGGYVLIAPLIGIPADAALALSLLKRGREMLLGAPACVAWQLVESGRFLKTRRTPAALP